MTCRCEKNMQNTSMKTKKQTQDTCSGQWCHCSFFLLLHFLALHHRIRTQHDRIALCHWIMRVIAAGAKKKKSHIFLLKSTSVRGNWTSKTEVTASSRRWMLADVKDPSRVKISWVCSGVCSAAPTNKHQTWRHTPHVTPPTCGFLGQDGVSFIYSFCMCLLSFRFD